MICPTCQTAANANSQGDFILSATLHAQCAHRDCFCQHGTGHQWVNYAR